MSNNILHSSIIRLHCTDLSINIMNTSARKHCYQGGVVDWRIFSAKYIYVLIMKWKSTERLLPRWSGRCKWQPWPAMPPKKHRNKQKKFCFFELNQFEDSVQQKKTRKPPHSQSCHHQFQTNLSHLPLLLDSPPTSKALHPPLHSWQVHSNLIKTSLKLLNWDLENSTCSNHSSLSSMPGLFGPSFTILLPFYLSLP